MRGLLLFLALALAALPAAGEEVVADLSQSRVSITASFVGSEILVFGAIRRDGTGMRPVDVIVTIEGPRQRVTVRRKARVGGIWVNRDAVEIDEAPSFYAVATTGPFKDVLSDTEDLRHKISIPRAIRAVGAPSTISDARAFVDALIRIRERDGIYRIEEGKVRLLEQTLFSTRIELPATLVEGVYRTRIFLTSDRAVVGTFETSLDVKKVGLERLIYKLAHERPLAYGLLAIFLAAFAGLAAAEISRYLRS